MRPSERVIASCGGRGEPILLDGGQGESWLVGDVVLKPALDPELVEWLDRCAPAVSQDRLRLCLPLRSDHGEQQVEGWTAFPRLDGQDARGQWTQLADVARTFADVWSEVAEPPFLRRRENPWERADHVAWGEAELDPADLTQTLRSLVGERTPVSGRDQLIHGDLTGNVLLAPDLPPAVIDITPYWRPVPYSVAIIAVDAVCFNGAPADLLATIDPSPDFRQYVLRALLFRMVTDTYLGIAQEGRYAVVIDWILG